MGHDFGAVAAFAVVAIGFALGGLTAGKLLRPYFPSEAKGTVYECGEKPIGTAWVNFNPRFYLIALIFVIFEVEIALTLPVVAVYKDWVAQSPAMGWIAFGELIAFTAFLLTGLAWVWVNGDLDWVKKLVDVEPSNAQSPARAAPSSRKAA
jgi:NADH-quinone oxidoreductase subunit A